MRRRGFTFIELVIAILILASAAAILILLFFTGYGHLEGVEHHRKALCLAQRLMSVARANLTVKRNATLFCGKHIALPTQFRSPVDDPVYQQVGFPEAPEGMSYTLEVDAPSADGSTGDGEELFMVPGDGALRTSVARTTRRVSATVVYDEDRTIVLNTFLANTHEY